MSETVKPYEPKHDDNPQCEHRLNPDTAEIVSRDEGGVAVEGRCLDCDYYLYEPVSVDEMSVYRRGV